MKEVNVLVTGAAGQIGYALLPRLASGETFGSDVIVNLRLVEIPQVVEKLNGTIMELEDCGFNTLGKVEAFLIFTKRLKKLIGPCSWEVFLEE